MNAVQGLREGVRLAYSAAAERPFDKHAFPVGREFALSVGYPREMLSERSDTAVEAFAGVSNVSIFAELLEGQKVLDLGCGAGLDSLIAARRVGPEGHVTGIDFSEAMLARAREAQSQSGLGNLTLLCGDAEETPCPTGSIDAVLVNGMFNLNPRRDAIFRELARVLRPGGSAYVAELILKEPLPPDVCASEANWFA